MSRRSNQPRATPAQVQARFSTARRPADTSTAEGMEWQHQRAEQVTDAPREAESEQAQVYGPPLSPANYD